MSFDFKGPGYKPVIQEAQQMLNNGGGGNLGYFKRGKKDDGKGNHQKGDLFEGHDEDSFEHQLEGEEEEKDLLGNIKSWFKNLSKEKEKQDSPKENPFIQE